MIDHRLGELEEATKEIKKDVASMKTSLATIEAHMTHKATKAWILGGTLGGMGVAAVVTVGVLKLFF